MKKKYTILGIISTTIIIIIILFFYFGDINILNNCHYKIINNYEKPNGIYSLLQFENLRYDNGNYYIKFSRQLEPAFCNKECEEYGVGGSLLPIERKEPEINLEKEYKFIKNIDNSFKNVNLFYFNNDSSRQSVESILISDFFEYINHNTTLDEGYYYGSVVDNPQEWWFHAVFINGEIVSISQIFQQ